MTGVTEPEDRARKELIAAAIVERKIRQARVDPAAFNEYVLLDDQQEPLEQQWFHNEWQGDMTEHDRLVIFSSVEHGKSVQASVARPMWELGRNPTSRGAIISDTATQATKMLTAIKANVEANPRLHDVFPHLCRENFRTWRDDAILYESEQPTTEKDFTVQAVGLGGAIMGARLNWIIIDDVLNLENTWTEDQCQKVIEWYQTTVLTRALKGCKIWVVGTAWSPFDLMHWLEKQGEFKVVRYPAVIAPDEWEQKMGFEYGGELFHGKAPIWPDRWPAERLYERERQLTPFRFRQLFLCSAVDESTTPFTDGAIAKCKIMGLGVPYSPDDWNGPVFTGVDLAAGKTRRAAETVFFTIGLTPDGYRYVLDVRSGRWHASQIEKIMVDIHDQFGSIFMVENNAVQQLVVEFLQHDTGIPIHPFHTGRQKAHPEFGVESMAVEMAQGQWIIPNVNGIVHPNVQRWINECAAYTPSAHTGDHLMASWFAREALRRFERRGRTVSIRLIGQDKRKSRQEVSDDE